MRSFFTKADLRLAGPLSIAGKDRPFQILALLETHELGDLISNIVFLSTLADQFDHSRLHVRFRDVRTYSRDVISLSPWVDLAEPFRGEWPRFVQRLFPPTRLLKPLIPMSVGSQKGKKSIVYDMIVTSAMAGESAVHALPNPARLSLPAQREGALLQGLAERGLRDDQWFAVFHYRETGYRFRPGGTDRDSDPAAFDRLVDAIVALGGQAVRLGHPGMTPFRPRAGFVDLSVEGCEFLLQAAAVSRARFMIAGPSGPMFLAPAFHIPHAFVDMVDTRQYWNLDRAHILTHQVTMPDGRVLRNQSLLDSGLLDVDRLTARSKAEPGYLIQKASAEELAHVARMLFDRTVDCGTWRHPPGCTARLKPNVVAWPPQVENFTPWTDL